MPLSNAVANPDRREVRRRDRNGAVAVEAIPTACEFGQHCPELTSPIPSRLQRLEGRSVVKGEVVGKRLGGDEAKREGLGRMRPAHTLLKQGFDVLQSAPQSRRGDPRGRRSVSADDLEEAADETIRSPTREGDGAARTSHPSDFSCGSNVVGSEHRAEDGQDRIEGGIGERKVLGVAWT